MIDAFFPCIRVQPVNPRARKVKPYFPGYVFARVDLEQTSISDLQWIPGAIGIVSFGGEPAYVSENFISTLQQYLGKINSSGNELIDSFNTGDEVSIKEGPFAGYQAIFDSRLQGSDRVRILLQMMQDQQIRVEIPVNQITWKNSAQIQA
jgi:transcriptional antiterminator RfaH